MATSAMNRALMGLRRRAEAADPEVLVPTFVDSGPLFASLTSHDHQILSGRRGTGKTHALYYLASQVEDSDEVAVYVDMRTIGSTGGIYADTNLSISDRGTRLLCDTLARIHDSLTDYALVKSEEFDATASFALLDRLGEAITDVVVIGEEEREVRTESTSATSSSASLDVRASPAMSATLESGSQSSTTDGRKVIERGVVSYRVHFGNVTETLRELLASLPTSRIWILLDEWSEVPMDLQPLLADLLNRALIPVRGYTLKIGAISYRSNFRSRTPHGDWIGMEVGAAPTEDLELDDFLVFGNDEERAKEFFREMLFKHVSAGETEELAGTDNALTLQREIFGRDAAFDEFVRAAEGVPRDGINILNLSAQKANAEKIGAGHVREAAKEWYVRNKEKAIKGHPEAVALLYWIIDEVIGERKARAFLLEEGEAAEHPLIGELYDARVIHLIKRGVSTHDRPGVRFDVYALDYGCYVDLMTTSRAPQGLFEIEDDQGSAAFIEVPTDDYRSIRRAILDLNQFESAS